MARIAITGHSAGIGQALLKIYETHGHEVVGLSRRNGYNIRSTSKIVEKIRDCDIFINNAQAGLPPLWFEAEGDIHAFLLIPKGTNTQELAAKLPTSVVFARYWPSGPDP